MSSQLVNIVFFVQVQVCRVVHPLCCLVSKCNVEKCKLQTSSILVFSIERRRLKFTRLLVSVLLKVLCFLEKIRLIYQNLVFISLLDDTSEEELMRNMSTLTIPEAKDSRSRPASPIPPKATPPVTNRSRTARSLSRPSRTCLKLHTENKPTNFVPFGWNEKKTTVGSKQTYNVSAPQKEVNPCIVMVFHLLYVANSFCWFKVTQYQFKMQIISLSTYIANPLLLGKQISKTKKISIKK